MNDVKIYKPSKNVMQSGHANTLGWIIEYEPKSRHNNIEPLMGWTSSSDTLSQIKLNFPSRAEAIAFAQKHGWAYSLMPEHRRRIKPRSYSDNFKYIPDGNHKKA